MDIFLQKQMDLPSGGIYSQPVASVRHVLLRMRALYFMSLGLLNKNTRRLEWQSIEVPGQFLIVIDRYRFFYNRYLIICTFMYSITDMQNQHYLLL